MQDGYLIRREERIGKRQLLGTLILWMNTCKRTLATHSHPKPEKN
jgi:hypothetical protein